MTNLTQAKYVFARARTVTPSDVLEAARPHSRLIGGLALTLAALVVSLIAWGPEMEFPVTVSTEEVATADGTDSVTLERTVREVAGDAIDDAVGWMTREGAWIFGRLSDGVTYSLLFIADVLKWLPWPAVVIGLVLVSYAVRGWSLAIVTSVALLFIGFMGLWPNTIDTIALMIVAVAIAVSAGLPHADDAQLRVSDSGHALLRPWEAGRRVRYYRIRGAACDTVDRAGRPARVAAGRGGGPVFRSVADAGADQGPDPNGAAHDHGGDKSDHDDGTGDGHDRQHGGGRRFGR